jgi:putative DNA-invertase from lambdoid prophage Rac
METASGAKDERAERKKVLALAQARNIDIILVTELTRWGRSMLDLFHTLQDLQPGASPWWPRPACSSICVVRREN